MLRVLSEAVEVAKERWEGKGKVFKGFIVVALVVASFFILLSVLVAVGYKSLKGLAMPVNKKNLGLYLPKVRRF